MSHEILIKRTIHVAKCEICGEQDIREDNPPKERFCFKCGKWVPYKEESYVGPSLKERP